MNIAAHNPKFLNGLSITRLLSRIAILTSQLDGAKKGIYMLKYTRIGLEIYYHSIPVNYLPLLNISAGRRIGCALGQHPGVRRWFPHYGTWTGQLLILIFNFENFF